MVNIPKEIHGMYALGWKIVTSRHPPGTNIFEKEWDHLIILDACRTDAVAEVGSEYDFLENLNETWSVGSTSKEWIEETFKQDYRSEIEETAYISANPYTNVLTGDRGIFDYPFTKDTLAHSLTPLHRLIKTDTVASNELAHLESLWVEGENRVDDGYTAPLPGKVTDHTIKAARSGKFDRIISHYMQPHTPYFSSSENYEELSDLEKHPHSYKKEEVWEAYLDNLRFVLDEVKVLLENVDGSVVITADHGELMGEMGVNDHPVGHIHPKLRKVPWIRTTGHDQKTRVPDVELSGVNENTEVSTEQLEALGYR